MADDLAEKYPHYHKRCGYATVDVYRVLEMFEVTDPCIQHAIKKLLAAGQRGTKDIAKDVAEAIVTLERWQMMRDEKARNPSFSKNKSVQESPNG